MYPDTKRPRGLFSNRDFLANSKSSVSQVGQLPVQDFVKVKWQEEVVRKAGRVTVK